jgi:hypothetical protein
VPDRSALLGPSAPCPTPFTIDGYRYVLPELPARTWLEALVCEQPGCWWRIIPTQLGDDGRLIERLVDRDDQFDLDDLQTAAETVAAAVCGVDFHAACRLAGTAYANWLLFDGWAATRGFDPLAVPIARLLAAVYAWQRGACTKESELGKLDAEIWAPPSQQLVSGHPREITRPAWSERQEEAAFMSLMGNLGG